jgi:calcineurin-like phosphoesterase family protein
MPNTWFTADFHLGHANIIGYCGRPFATVDEMDRAILERLNASAKPNDTLYFLGDFCMGSQARVLAYRKRIHCKKISAVPGNHDKQARKLKEEFSWLDNLAELSIHGHPIVLSLRFARLEPLQSRIVAPLRSFSRTSSRGTELTLHDAGVDTHNFRPWHYDEIADIMAKKAATREATNSS